jgi:hypothetical protein
MHPAIGGANDERWLDPGCFAHRLRHIELAHHREQPDQRGLSLFEYHGPAPHDGELSPARRSLDALNLFFGKHAGEEAAGGQMPGGNHGVVRDVPPHLEPAGDLLRMVAVDSGVQWKVWRAAQHEIESLVRP